MRYLIEATRHHVEEESISFWINADDSGNPQITDTAIALAQGLESGDSLD
jgi:hypothetical protein